MAMLGEKGDFLRVLRTRRNRRSLNILSTLRILRILTILAHILLEGGSDDIEEFGGDGCLTSLVVLEGEVVEQLVGIVGGCLHGDDAGRVFSGKAVEDCGKELEGYAFGQQRLKELTARGLD